MDANTRPHPLVKATLRSRAVPVRDDDAPRFELQLRPSQVQRLEGLLGWLERLQRDKRIAPELLRRGSRMHTRALDGVCQELYERGGRVGFRPLKPDYEHGLEPAVPANDVEPRS